MVKTAEAAVVRKSVRVHVPIERAFSVFVEQMETWWPPEHHIGANPFQSIFVEPRTGGRWYERDAQGNECQWGQVLAWEPPHRVTFSWHLGPDLSSIRILRRRVMLRSGSRARGLRRRWLSWSIAGSSVMERAMSSFARCWTGRMRGLRRWRSLRRRRIGR